MPDKKIDNDKFDVRKTTDYLKLNRWFSANHFRTEKTKEKPKVAEFQPGDFFSRKIFRWFYYYIQNRFGFNHSYTCYDNTQTGVFRIDKTTDTQNDPVVIGIAGDWGTYTAQSIEVARKMGGHNPHYTIHIGDTYFVGAPHEIINNFIAPESPWFRGSKGSFALLGNHEMYARGIAYFDELLPTLGLNEPGGWTGQQAPYFCLENDHWRILGLDTGYHSIGKIPVIEMIPWFAPNCRFPKKMMQWLKEIVKLDDPGDKRSLLILTHHQYISAFKNETEYITPARQLASLIGRDRPVLWIWGHEHKFSLYEKACVDGGPLVYGRCIGHGGMPLELDKFARDKNKKGFDKLVMVDERPVPGTEDYPLGFNGYAMIKLSGADLRIEYHDTNGHLLSEHWKADGAGRMIGDITPPQPLTGLHEEKDKNWNDAVK